MTNILWIVVNNLHYVEWKILVNILVAIILKINCIRRIAWYLSQEGSLEVIQLRNLFSQVKKKRIQKRNLQIEIITNIEWINDRPFI